MKSVLATLALVAAVAGCKNREGDGPGADTLRRSADTAVTEREVKDTTIVTTDTLIRQDTIKKLGGRVDTVVKTRPRQP